MRKRSTVVAPAAVLAASAVLAAGLGSGPAQAVPAPQSAATAVAAAAQTTLKQKVEAAAVLGVTVDSKLAVLSDRDFTFALWQRAVKDKPEFKEVRASAELALLDDDAACTAWITDEIFAAKNRDEQDIVRDETAARIARERKQRAAATLGVEAAPEQLAMNYQNFVFWVWKHEKSGANVKQAAEAAWSASDADRIVFLDEGLRTAHGKDQAADTEAERDRIARKNAASMLSYIPTEGELGTAWVNFVILIRNKAEKDSEIYVAAQDAVFSGSEAAQKAFVYTGIYEAFNRELKKQQDKVNADNRRLLQELKTRAENGRLQPALVAAATKALAATPKEISDFLRVGQYNEALTRQSVQVTTPGLRDRFVRAVGAEVSTSSGDSNANTTDVIAGSTWKVVPGLADTACFSLESGTTAGSYLRVKDLRAWLNPSDGTAGFKNDATWCAKPGLTGTGVTLESKAVPGRFLRHHGTALYAANDSGQNPFDAKNAYKEDATWAAADPEPRVSTPVMSRWHNDDYFRARLGNPKADEVVDKKVRYRDFERGRAYWTQSTGTHLMYGEALTKFTTKTPGVIDLDPVWPVTDTSPTPDGIGTLTHFKSQWGGDYMLSIYWSPNTGAHKISGAIRLKWSELGWENSPQGYPTTDEEMLAVKDANGAVIFSGRQNHFQNGLIFWSSKTQKVYTHVYTSPASDPSGRQKEDKLAYDRAIAAEK